MFLQTPVIIPRRKGITFRTKGKRTYVQYETKRIWDPTRKYTRVERCEIGVQVPGKPEMMLPNENYLQYFPEEERKMNEDEKELIEEYTAKRDRGYMLKDFFDHLYFEFQPMSRRKQDTVMNEDKVKRLNMVLGPLTEMMKEEEYAEFLQTIPEPKRSTNKDGEEIITGMTYSDVELLMSQFKGALSRFFSRKR